jgi:hypothetical protein
MKNIGIQLNDNYDTDQENEVLDLKIEPERDTTGKIVKGLLVDVILEQNITLMMLLHQGELKFQPDLGVGIQDISLSHDYLIYRHKIREHLEKDGLVVSDVDLYQNQPLNIVAKYGQ